MSDLVIFIVLVGAVAGGGIAIGMILAKRVDRVLETGTDINDDPAVLASAQTDDTAEEGPAA